MATLLLLSADLPGLAMVKGEAGGSKDEDDDDDDDDEMFMDASDDLVAGSAGSPSTSRSPAKRPRATPR